MALTRSPVDGLGRRALICNAGDAPCVCGDGCGEDTEFGEATAAAGDAGGRVAAVVSGDRVSAIGDCAVDIGDRADADAAAPPTADKTSLVPVDRGSADAALPVAVAPTDGAVGELP